MSESLALLRYEVQLEEQLSQKERDFAIAFFQPHAKQQQFYAAAGYHYRYARTGNRFGKSEMGAAEDIAFALGERPWYPEGHPLRVLGIPNHATKGLIITTDWDKSTEVFTETEGEKVGKLIKYIPKRSLVSMTKNHSGAIDRIIVKHKNGGNSIIRLDTVKSYKQNPLGQESGDNDWIHIDEPCPEGMWKAAARGLVDRKGHAWFTCTPISEPWIDAAFIPDLSDQTKSSIENQISETMSRWMMTGSMDDNPYNTPDTIALYMSWLTDEEKEARRHGIPLAYSGLVYKEFKWSSHVLDEPPVGWKDWLHPPADHCVRFAIDYHTRKNHHVLFIATSPSETHYVFAELWLNVLIPELVEEIKAVLSGRELACPGIIDPLANTENQVTGITEIDKINQLGLPVMPATKDPHNGILKVKEVLKTRDRAGYPILYVSKQCPRFLFEISRGFIWDGDTNKPVKLNDDAMENFYRLCLQGLTYIPPSEDSDYSPTFRRDPGHTSINPFEFGEPEESDDLASRFASRYRS